MVDSVNANSRRAGVRSRVVLVDAPADGELRCEEIGLASALGELVTVRLREPEWRGSCEFKRGAALSVRSRVTILAGEINAVAWLEP